MPLYLGNEQISKISIATDSANTSDATLTSGAQMLNGVTAYSNNVKYTGTIPTVNAPSPTITIVDDGTITASVSNPKGYQSSDTIKTTTQQLVTQESKVITPNDSVQTAVASNVYTTGEVTVSAVPIETKTITANGTYSPSSGKYFSSINVNVPEETFNTQTKSVTPTESEQTVSPDIGYDGLSGVTINAIPSTYVGSGVPTQDAATFTPTTTDQTIDAGQYLSGAQTIQGDANLIPENIASGVSIFGVTGTHQGGSNIDTSDATATETDIINGKTAYVNGTKVTGTLVVQNYYTGTTAPESATGGNGDLYFKVVR